jgi:multiple sugar transport system permease protein
MPDDAGAAGAADAGGAQRCCGGDEVMDVRSNAAGKVRIVVIYAVLLIWVAFTIIPLYWMLVTSLTDATMSATLSPSWFPLKPSLAPYARFLGKSQAPRWLLNSAIVACAITLGNVIFSSMAGYAFAKLRFPGRDAIFWILLSTMMLPYHVTLIPTYILVINKLGMGDTYTALIVPFLCTVSNTFLMKQYMSTLPSTLIEAARIDACTEFGIYRKIIFPIAKPGLAVVAIFTFVSYWNQFFWPFLVTSSNSMRTVQVGLASFRFAEATDFGAMMAGAVLASLPVVALFFSLQKYFLQGITVGALKG